MDDIENDVEDTEDQNEEEEDRESEAFENMRYDYKMAKDSKSTIDKLIIEWNDLYYGKKMGNENPQKSQIILKEIAKQIEWQKPALMEPFTSSSNPIRIKTGKNENRARIMQKYLNGQFAGEFDREEFMNQLTDVLLREGTAWIRTGWNFTEEKTTEHHAEISMEEMLEKEGEPKKVKQNENGTYRAEFEKKDIIENMPTLEVCRNEHIFPDPSARTMNEMRFLIYEKFMTISELRETGMYDEEKLEALEQKLSAESREDTSLGAVRDADARDYGYNQTYQPKDATRKKIAILEYWGKYDLDGDGISENIVAIWAKKEQINLYIGENPYPSKNIPFNRVVYSARPFSLWGNSLAYFVGDNQRVKSGIMRGILDNMALANNGQKFVQRGALDYVNFKKLRNGEKHIIVNKPDSIHDGTYNNLPTSIFTTMEMVSQETKDLVGNVSGGQQMSMKNNSEDSTQQLSMSQQRIAGTVRNISNVLSKALKEWLMMAEKFLTNEQIEGMFLQQDAQDIMAFEDARFVQTSIKVGTEVIRSLRIQQLNLLMQQSKTLGERTPQDVIPALVAEMFELFDMYEKAEEIRNFKPQPDQNAMQMQQLQMQFQQLTNQKLQAEIQIMNSKAGLDQTDSQVKQIEIQSNVAYKDAQTKEKMAKAQAHMVDTAMKPLEMRNKQQGGN